MPLSPQIIKEGRRPSGLPANRCGHCRHAFLIEPDGKCECGCGFAGCWQCVFENHQMDLELEDEDYGMPPWLLSHYDQRPAPVKEVKL